MCIYIHIDFYLDICNTVILNITYKINNKINSCQSILNHF